MQKLLPVIALFLCSQLHADDWPQWRGLHRDAVWRETGILESFPKDGLKVIWRAPANISFSSPTIARGRVYFIDTVFEPIAQERVRCFNERTGQPIWNHLYAVKYPDWAVKPESRNGPVATPLVYEGKVYTLGRSGMLFCFAADDGKIQWQKDVAKEYSIKEFYATSSPLIEGDLLILQLGGKPEAGVVAFDRSNGKEVWKALDEEHYHCSPIVIESGGQRQLIVWTQASVSSLYPANGKLWWREKFLGGTPVSTPVFDKSSNRLLIAGLMLQLNSDKPAAKVLWPRSSAAGRRILSSTSTAAILGDHVYSAKSSGEFVCLDANTGEEVWSTDKITDTKNGPAIHITLNGDSALLFTDQGHLIRARLTPDGYEELSRTVLLPPTYPWSGRKVIWPPPAYANGHVFVHNDTELICVSLEKRP